MIPLHVHSYYSLLKGTIPVSAIIETAKAYKLNSIALTDTNGMYGLIQFAKKAAENNIKPIFGAYIDNPDDTEINTVLLAKNNEGYSALCKIITSRKLNDDFSLINLLNNEHRDLFIISSSLKLLSSIHHNKNLFAGLDASKNKKGQTRNLFEYAQAKELKYVVTSPVYFLKSEDYRLHKTLTAIRLNKTLDNLDKSELADEDYYFKDPDDLKKLWNSVPEAISNSHYIAENCNVDLQLNKYKFPVFPVPLNESSFSHLTKIAYDGLKVRYKPVTKAAEERLFYELDVIRELGFPDYFLVVWDIVNEAKKRGMMIIGRGSAANSIVSYCLGFTQVDPIKYNFYFERFLNKGRSSPPDVDLDFSWKERDEIIKYVFDKYGYEKVAMISTHVTFRARSAFRETAKVFGFSDSEISKYSKFIPWTDAHNLPNLSALFPESRSLNFNIEPWKSIVEIAVQIAGFPRHLSIHPGGILLTPSAITDYTALEYAKNKGFGLIITQPDMYSIEDLGLIKIDLLSQRSLGVLRDTMNAIEKGSKEV